MTQQWEMTLWGDNPVLRSLLLLALRGLIVEQSGSAVLGWVVARLAAVLLRLAPFTVDVRVDDETRVAVELPWLWRMAVLAVVWLTPLRGHGPRLEGRRLVYGPGAPDRLAPAGAGAVWLCGRAIPNPRQQEDPVDRALSEARLLTFEARLHERSVEVWAEAHLADPEAVALVQRAYEAQRPKEWEKLQGSMAEVDCGADLDVSGAGDRLVGRLEVRPLTSWEVTARASMAHARAQEAERADAQSGPAQVGDGSVNLG
jgi:hypothetical protein